MRPHKTKKFLLASLVLSSLTLPVYGTNYTWNLTTGGEWTDSSNWNPTGYPQTFSDLAIIDNQTAAYTITTSAPSVSYSTLEFTGLENITLSPGGGFTGLHIIDQAILFNSSVDPISYNLTVPIQFGPDAFPNGFSCASNVGSMQFAGTLSETTPGTGLVLSFFPGAFTAVPEFTLSAPATYTGGTTIGSLGGDAVNLILTGAGTLSTQGTLTINSGTFDMSAGPGIQTITDLVGASGTINLGSNTLIITSNPGSTLYPGVIQGTGGNFFKDGAGDLTMSGTISNTGAILINQGSLIVTGPTALNTASTVGVGSTLNLTNPGYAGDTLTLANLFGGEPSAVIQAGNVTLSVPLTTSASYAGGIQAPSAAVNISGSNTLSMTLTGNSSFSNATLGGPGVIINSTNSLGGSASSLFFTGGSLTLLPGSIASFAGSVTINTSSILSVGSGATLTFAGQMYQNGGSTIAYTKNDGGTLVVSNANNSATGGISGQVVINAGSLMPSSDNAIGTLTATITFGGAGSAALVAGGTINATRNVVLNNTTYFDTNNSSITLGGTVSGSNGFVKLGNGVLTLDGNNSFSGAATVTLGTLNVARDNALLNAGAIFLGSGTSNATLQAGPDLALLINPITLGAAGGVLDNNNHFIMVSSNIAGTGSLGFIGIGEIFLNGSLAYTGATFVQEGRCQPVVALPNTTDLTVTTPGILDLSLSSVTQRVRGLTGTGSIIMPEPPHVFRAGSNQSTAFSGSMVDGTVAGGSFQKVGTGTLTLSGTLSYTGQTAVVNGSLVLTSTAISTTPDIANAEILIFNPTDTRSFASTISGVGTVVVQGTGSLSWSGGSSNTYTGDTTINSGNLVLDVTGNAIVGGTITVTGGNLYVDGANQITAGTNIVVNAGLLDLAGNSIVTNSLSYSGGSIASTGAISLAGSGTVLTMGPASLTLSPNISLATAGSSIVSTGSAAVINNIAFNAGGNLIATSGNLALNTSSGGGFTLASGILTLNVGMHNYAAAPVVTQSGSNLVLLGSLTASTVTILSGATLQGTGTLTGNLNLQGTLAPGNSIGTINLIGAQSFGATSVLVAEISNSSNSADLVNITGTLSIAPGATLQIVPVPNNFISGDHQYVLVQTTGGVTGTFVLDTSNSLINDFYEVIYTGNSVILAVQAQAGLNLITQGNPGKVAQVITQAFDNQIIPPNSDIFYVVQNLLNLGSTSELIDALNQMQPSMLKGLFLAQENSSIRVQQGISLRIDHLISKACLQDINRLTLWTDGLGDYFHQSEKGLEPGLHGASGGLTLGLDYIARELFGGVAASYSYTNVVWQSNRGLGNINSGYASLYGGYSSRHFYIDGIFEASYNHYNEKRRIIFPGISRTAKGHFNGSELLGQIEAGGLLHVGRTEFRPFLSSEILYLHAQGFQESGADSIDLNLHSSNYLMARSELGINFSHCFGYRRYGLRIDAKLSYIREDRFQGNVFKTALVSIPYNFNVHGLNPDRNLFSPGLSLSFVPKGSGSALSIDYEAEIGSSFWDQNMRLQYGYKF